MVLYFVVRRYLREKQQELSSFCEVAKNLVAEECYSELHDIIKYCIVLGVVFYLLLIALVDLSKQVCIIDEMIKVAPERLK